MPRVGARRGAAGGRARAARRLRAASGSAAIRRARPACPSRAPRGGRRRRAAGRPVRRARAPATASRPRSRELVLFSVAGPGRACDPRRGGAVDASWDTASGLRTPVTPPARRCCSPVLAFPASASRGRPVTRERARRRCQPRRRGRASSASHYEFGPDPDQRRAQNTIEFEGNDAQAATSPGWIVALHAEPRVHRRQDPARRRHPPAPRRVAGQRRAALRRQRGEDDRRPARGLRLRYTPKRQWLINYMIHNLTPNPDEVYITYEIDFVPDTAPEAAGHEDGPHALDGRGRLRQLPGVRRAAQRYGHKGGGSRSPTTKPDLKGLGPAGARGRSRSPPPSCRPRCTCTRAA